MENKTERLSNHDESGKAFFGLHYALQYVDGRAREKGLLAEEDILEIHRRCMNGLLLDTAIGAYRKESVVISRASITPPHYSRVPGLMDAYVKEVNKRLEKCGQGICHLEEDIETLAFIPYAFFRIHPFEDGNGRTARLLCDLVAKRCGLRPIISWPAEREEYLEAIRAVDRSGSLTKLELLVIKCLSQRYQSSKSKKDKEMVYQLSRLRQEKEREIEIQPKRKDLRDVWSIFGHPALE